MNRQVYDSERYSGAFETISGPLRASDARRPWPFHPETPTFGGIRVQWGLQDVGGLRLLWHDYRLHGVGASGIVAVFTHFNVIGSATLDVKLQPCVVARAAGSVRYLVA